MCHRKQNKKKIQAVAVKKKRFISFCVCVLIRREKNANNKKLKNSSLDLVFISPIKKKSNKKDENWRKSENEAMNENDSMNEPLPCESHLQFCGFFFFAETPFCVRSPRKQLRRVGIA